MLSSIWSSISSRARKTAAVLAFAAATTVAANVSHADEAAAVKSAYSASFGLDFTSHFISYGADVWGGGDVISPFSPRSTAFGYGTLNVAFADNVTGFINIWGDLNDNVDSGIGGPIQEIDFNTGVTVTFDKVALTLTHGFWNYAGDEEKILDFTVGYNDADLYKDFADGLALNPSFTVHWRYDGNGPQEDGAAFVPGIKPSFTFLKDSRYPVTLAVPTSIAFFTDEFQGGDSGYGYFTVGLTASVPLAFIPAKYGTWTASAGLAYWNTPEDAIPNNPEENFITTTLSVGVSF